MKTGVVALLAAIFGGIGVILFLVAFATDYWLLASDDCGGYEVLEETTFASPSLEELSGSMQSSSTQINTMQLNITQSNSTESNITESSTAESYSTALETTVSTSAETLVVTAGPVLPTVMLHHEGFFWRCWFRGDPSFPVVWAVLFTNQPVPKYCIQGYLFPLPVAIGPVPHPIYDATAVFRGFWTIFIILAMAASVVAGFLLVCAVPFYSAKLYKVGGAFLMTAACLFLALVCLFVIWKELVDVGRYILQERGEMCPGSHLETYYGWSFMAAAAGIPLVNLSGILFFLIGVVIQRHKQMTI